MFSLLLCISVIRPRQPEECGKRCGGRGEGRLERVGRRAKERGENKKGRMDEGKSLKSEEVEKHGDRKRSRAADL